MLYSRFIFKDEESIDFNNGVKQSAKIVFDEDQLAKPKYRSLANEKDERYIEGGDYKIEGRLYTYMYTCLWCFFFIVVLVLYYLFVVPL